MSTWYTSFKGLVKRNLQYEMRICQKIYNKVSLCMVRIFMDQTLVWLSTVWYVFTVLWLNLFCHELVYHTCKANSSLQMFCSCPPQNLLRKWFIWFRFNLKNPPLNLVQQQSVWYILAVLWQDFGCHELFSTDISMHLRKRSVEGALCVEIGVYTDISWETKFTSRTFYLM